MDEKQENKPLHYPRKMRKGWCVAHEVTAAGITIEKYGIRCQTYTEAFRRAEVMNREPQEIPDGGKPIATAKGGEKV